MPHAFALSRSFTWAGGGFLPFAFFGSFPFLLPLLLPFGESAASSPGLDDDLLVFPGFEALRGI
jgi:hypothetical protein